MKNSSDFGSAAISRRKLLMGSIAAGAAPLLLATKANATAKVSQAAVHFKTAANTDHNCGACRHFMAPSSCRFVEGTISSDCSCWIWTSKLG
jgi:secreted PhoX family phosphatase